MVKNRSRILSIAFCSLLAVLLGLFSVGAWGTTPTNESTMVGNMEIQMADGSKLITIDSDEQGQATITFRGIKLEGKLVHNMSTQTSETYDLQINSSSVGDPKKLSLQLVVPPDGITGDKTGTWCIRFRNMDEQDKLSGMGSLFIGLSQQKTWYAQFGDETTSIPYEVFDWLTLYADGSGVMHNEQFIPTDLLSDKLTETARSICWQAADNSLTLTEA